MIFEGSVDVITMPGSDRFDIEGGDLRLIDGQWSSSQSLPGYADAVRGRARIIFEPLEEVTTEQH